MKAFPTFAHPSGQWAKKISGKLYRFGFWADPEAALATLNSEYPYLKEGRPLPAVAVSSCSPRRRRDRAGGGRSLPRLM